MLRYSLGQVVCVTEIEEHGEVIARTEFVDKPPEYCVRVVSTLYGNFVSWWKEAALNEGRSLTSTSPTTV